MTPTPPPPAPAHSDFPAPKAWGVSAGAAFKFGDCTTGAIVTIAPAEAVMVSDVFYATDGGVAFITVTNFPQHSYVLRAWSSSTGAYLGEYQGTP
jgi:hypothetical protein